MSAAVYGDRVAEVEPFGIDPIAVPERHGRPSQLFGLWFSANAETATWSVGILTVALYGTSLKGAILGILLGNAAGYALLGLLSTFGPRYGLPQMMQSRLAFGLYGNMLPAALAFLAGIGWFAVDCVLGAYALGSLVHLPYLPALAIMLAIQVAIVIYGYNMIHLFERITAVALAAGFLVLGVVTAQHADWSAPFNPHAPLAQGGESAGVILAIALAFSYVIGWVPAASDYSRYLPQATSSRAIWSWVFLGGFLPCTVLEIMGAGAVTALPRYDLAALQPTAAVTLLLGTGLAGSLGLVTIMLGTLTANCLNLYSGALSALAVRDPAGKWTAAIALGAVFGIATYALLAVASSANASVSLGLKVICALAVAVVVVLAARIRFERWQAAIVVGALGGALAMLGAHPEQTAQLYTDFLLLLSAWASPWAGVVIVQWWLTRRGAADASPAFALVPPVRAGLIAWFVGLAVSIPFLDQAWFAGWIVRANPWLGDISYEVGMLAAAATMLATARFQKA